MFDCNNLIITQEKAIASIFINTKKQLEKVVLEIGEPGGTRTHDTKLKRFIV